MAEFLTVNLSDVFRNQKSVADLAAIKPQNEPETKRDTKQISDWAKELENRLEQNRALGASKRKNEYEVETTFFEDYFNNGNAAWDANCAELLLSLGDPLKKAIKVLGFNTNVNPILGFITDEYVIRSLLFTKLLNVNTFKAIYNAVAKKLVVDSEFFAANTYNIIYCQDLYKKSAAEIIEYLTVQKAILKPSASTYTEEDQERNKKVFFKISGIKELEDINEPNAKVRYKKISSILDKLDANAQLPSATENTTKLNELSLAKALAYNSANNFDDADDDAEDDNDNSVAADSTDIEALARKIGSNSARAFAAVQYLSATTSTPVASKALAHDMFKSVTIDAVVKATAEVVKVMKEAKLSDKEVKRFITLLLSKIKKDT